MLHVVNTGLTETCAASFISVPGDPRLSGTVGPPQPSISFRLESVPEMNYDPMADPPRGEICIRGESVFIGYHKDDEKTKEVCQILVTSSRYHTSKLCLIKSVLRFGFCRYWMKMDGSILVISARSLPVEA